MSTKGSDERALLYSSDANFWNRKDAAPDATVVLFGPPIPASRPHSVGMNGLHPSPMHNQMDAAPADPALLAIAYLSEPAAWHASASATGESPARRPADERLAITAIVRVDVRRCATWTIRRSTLGPVAMPLQDDRE